MGCKYSFISCTRGVVLSMFVEFHFHLRSKLLTLWGALQKLFVCNNKLVSNLTRENLGQALDSYFGSMQKNPTFLTDNRPVRL